MRIKNLEEFQEWVNIYINRSSEKIEYITETYCEGLIQSVSLPNTDYTFVFEYDDEDIVQI